MPGPGISFHPFLRVSYYYLYPHCPDRENKASQASALSCGNVHTRTLTHLSGLPSCLSESGSRNPWERSGRKRLRWQRKLILSQLKGSAQWVLEALKWNIKKHGRFKVSCFNVKANIYRFFFKKVKFWKYRYLIRCNIITKFPFHSNKDRDVNACV